VAQAEYRSTLDGSGNVIYFVAENTEDDDETETITWYDYYTQIIGG
jgi:hypothetical protein